MPMDRWSAAASLADTHAKYSAAVAILYESMDLISDGAIYLDPDLLNQGSALMMTGMGILDSATASIPVSAAACA